MSSMVLEWEESEPIECRDDLSLTEFSLVGTPIPGSMISSLEFDEDPDGDFRKFSELILRTWAFV